MRTEYIRAYKEVHTWSGIVTGLALFIAFYAGALTMFESSIARWSAPPPRVAITPLAQAAELIDATIAARPDAAREMTLHLADDPPLSRLTWQKGRHDPRPWSAELLDEGTLDIRQVRAEGVAQFIDTLHRTAGVTDAYDSGETFMGIVSVIYGVALISGLIVLLPSLLKDLFILRMDRSRKRMWLDAHNLMGLTGLPFHLIIALTSVVFCLHDPIYAVQNHVVYDGNLRGVVTASGFSQPKAVSAEVATMLTPEALVARAKALSPDFIPRHLYYRNAQTSEATVRVSGDDPRYMVANRGFVILNAITGELISQEHLPGHRGSWSAIVSGFFAAHFGSYGGEPVRWAYFFLGLAGAFVFYTGNLLWLETRRQRAIAAGSATLPRNQRVLASLTAGVVFGCIIGISLAMLMARWAPAMNIRMEAVFAPAYYAAFFSCVLWALGRGDASSSVQLAWIASIAYFALPISSLIAVALPDIGLWLSSDAWGVDLTALIAAFSMRRVAKRGTQRVRSP